MDLLIKEYMRLGHSREQAVKMAEAAVKQQRQQMAAPPTAASGGGNRDMREEEDLTPYVYAPTGPEKVSKPIDDPMYRFFYGPRETGVTPPPAPAATAAPVTGRSPYAPGQPLILPRGSDDPLYRYFRK